MTDSTERLRAALADRYPIERELGRGGMATVYLARDARHGRQVALKVLHPALAAGLGTQRFLREVRIAAALQHPHILPVHDSGEAAGQLYYVMPYVEGETLRARLDRDGPLPVDEAVRLGREVLDALSYAHRHDVVHRDIKPENILLSDGHALVADFGIAKALVAAGDEHLTETGWSMGTPPYMSPEQIGGGALDGRSDLYGLGCVLQEMLTGEPPFSGKTPQELFAKHVRDQPPPLRTRRPEAPVAVEQAIERALAKAPDQRFATAMDFAVALETPLGIGTVLVAPDRSRWRTAIPTGLLLTLAAGALALLLSRVLRSNPTAGLDADLVAVAPFDILDPKLALWHEGLVDYLSRNLDGAGPLRSVPSTMAIRRWSGHADKESARDLGRRTGAKLVVYGQLVGVGPDSVRLRAALLDASTGSTVAEFDRPEAADHIDRLADSITLDVLRGLGQAQSAQFARLSSVGTASFAALKAFLQGEQFFRRSAWDSAIVHFGRAIDLDTNFALALRRQALALGWADDNTDRAAPLGWRAVARNHGLAPRDSLLLAADSFGMAAGDRGNPRAWSHGQRQLETLREATRRYPTDPEAWYQLAEAQWHGHPFGFALRVHLQAFARAIELDPSFTPAYHHAIQISFGLNDAALAGRYLRSYPVLSPSTGEDAGASLVTKLLGARDSVAVSSLLDRAAHSELVSAWDLLGAPDSTELRLQVLRRLASGVPGAKGFAANLASWNAMLARELIRRGHLRQARELKGLRSRSVRRLGLLGALEADSASRAFSAWLRTDLASASDGIPWWIAQRDTAALSRFVRRADSAAKAARAPGTEREARSWAAHGRAALALARRDSAGALRQLASLPDSLSLCCADLGFGVVEAQLLGAAGRDSEAVSVLLLHWEEDLGPLELGRVAERLGDTEQARQAYQDVLDTWRHADPELNGYVAEARAGLERLTAEPRSP